jgi:nitrate reductase NapE component
VGKSSKNRERREMVERMQREAKTKERRRTLIVVAVCVVVAVIIVGAAGWTIWQDQRERDEIAGRELADIGSAATDAGCGPIQEKSATGAGDHVPNGPVEYDVRPPSFGPHRPVTAESGIHFYTLDDRPEVEQLVHNLEHGWTIVWYSDDIDDAQLKQIRATAEKFDAFGSDPQYNVIFAPWTDDDGAAIPDGKSIAFAHWSVHQPEFDMSFYDSGEVDSWGQSQYCTSFSGAALEDFMNRYPYDDAPEGYLWHQAN